MSIAKSLSSPGNGRKQPDTGRRSFIWKTGAAVSAVFASAVAGVSKPSVKQADSAEDSNAVRTLHRTYEARLHEGRYEEALALFSDKAEVVYNGGLFAGDKGLRRLYCSLFTAGQTGRKVEPAAGFEPDPAQETDIVVISADGKSATGRFPYSMLVGTPMEGDSSLVAMARLHGEGIMKWWEGGTCEASYEKAGRSWKIKRLEYGASAKAEYRPGRKHAKAIDVPAFAHTYPGDPKGPDRLV